MGEMGPCVPRLLQVVLALAFTCRVCLSSCPRQAFPRLIASFWVLAGHPPSHYYDDLAIAGLVGLLGRCLLLSPDLRPSMLQAGLMPYLLAACIGPQVVGQSIGGGHSVVAHSLTPCHH